MSATTRTRGRPWPRLRERGLRIGLLSNTHWPRAFLERFLERDGLAGLIDVRLYTSEMPFQKPHPTAFRAALDALEVDDPSTAVFVGDRPWDDISGASGVGHAHRPPPQPHGRTRRARGRRTPASPPSPSCST